MGRGRLRVYLGAAPGVGKTYAMPCEGRRRLERGTDLVVGYVETLGRPRTAALLEGMEAVPRRTGTSRASVAPTTRSSATTCRGRSWSSRAR